MDENIKSITNHRKRIKRFTKNTALPVTEEMYQALSYFADKQKMSIAEVIRGIIEDSGILTRYEQETSGGATVAAEV